MSDVECFPANIVSAVLLSVEDVEGIEAVVGRPVRPLDPNACAGVYAVDWLPQDYSIGQHEPAIAKYCVNIQVLIKHMNEEEARLQHSVLSKRVRTMVSRDTDFRVRLAALSETSMGVTERAQKWSVRAQRFLSNEIEGQFLFLSTMELVVDVETV